MANLAVERDVVAHFNKKFGASEVMPKRWPTKLAETITENICDSTSVREKIAEAGRKHNKQREKVFHDLKAKLKTLEIASAEDKHLMFLNKKWKGRRRAGKRRQKKKCWKSLRENIKTQRKNEVQPIIKA